MAAKGSRLSRAISYFREADLDEARVAFTLVDEVMTKRLGAARVEGAPARTRKPRRTKAQLAAERAADRAAMRPDAHDLSVGAS